MFRHVSAEFSFFGPHWIAMEGFVSAASLYTIPVMFMACLAPFF